MFVCVSCYLFLPCLHFRNRAFTSPFGNLLSLKLAPPSMQACTHTCTHTHTYTHRFVLHIRLKPSSAGLLHQTSDTQQRRQRRPHCFVNVPFHSHTRTAAKALVCRAYMNKNSHATRYTATEIKTTVSYSVTCHVLMA